MKRATAAVFMLMASWPLLAADLKAPELYKSKCAICHGPNGNAKVPLNLGSAPVQKMTDEQLAAAIATGELPKRPSHAFRDKGLTEEQIKVLVAYIRSLKK
jgi:mono/diheme cytochrome c family protein